MIKIIVTNTSFSSLLLKKFFFTLFFLVLMKCLVSGESQELSLPPHTLREGKHNTSVETHANHHHRDVHHFIDKASYAHYIHNSHHIFQFEGVCSHREPWEVELEEFVHNPATKTVLYIFYHDAPSRDRAMNLSLCHDWMYPVRLKLSPYMENQVYRDVFSYLHKYWLDRNISYIITTSYKIMESTDLSFDPIQRVTLKDYFHLLKLAHEEQYDLIPLVRTHIELLPQAIREHGNNFRVGWEAVLQGMGYDLSQIRALDNTHSFFKNALIATTPTFLTLTNFLTFATNLMETNSSVIVKTSVDAQYRGKMTKEQKEIAFHAPYYKMFPFILERLPVFFAYHFHMKICDAHNPKCSANLRRLRRRKSRV